MQSGANAARADKVLGRRRATTSSEMAKAKWRDVMKARVGMICTK